MNATVHGMHERDHCEGRTLVVGLGRTGLSVTRFLVARGAEVAVADVDTSPPALAALREELPDVALFLGGYPEQLLQRAQCVVLSPGVPLRDPAIAAALHRGVEVIGDIELFARTAAAPVVAVTGSNGKSTVTSLLAQMAQAAGRVTRAGGNLGTPALELLQDSEPDLYVLELSSFQLETTHSLNATAATVLNVTSDHMDRYDSLRDYAAAKRRIFRGTGVMVLNADDPTVAAMAEDGRRSVHFSVHAPRGDGFGLCEREGRTWLAQGSTLLLDAGELRLWGRHNLANVLAALALGHAIGLPMEAMLSAARNFRGLPHRTQWVAECDGVNWYDDSKGTNVGATLAALEGMPEPVVLIAGGKGKGADFTPLRDAVRARARAVVLIGQDAPAIAEALQDVVPVVRAAGMEQAVREARRLAQAGDSVLLSPACASFDMFSGYEERGRVFAAAVHKELGA